MKKAILFFLPLLILSACYSSVEESGSITISIGEPSVSRASAWPPTSITGWIHTVRVTGAAYDKSEEIPISGTGSGSVTFSNVPNGTYTVEVSATSSGVKGTVLEAVGSCQVTVAGNTVSANIKMIPLVYIGPNSLAQERYIFWENEPITVDIASPSLLGFTPTLYEVWDSPTAMSPLHTDPLTPGQQTITYSIPPGTYSDDFYVVVSDGTTTLTSNKIDVFRPVKTMGDLESLGGAVSGKTHILAENINMSGSYSVPNLPSGVTFDGNGKKIIFLMDFAPSTLSIGVFDINQGIIKNLRLEGSISVNDPSNPYYVSAVAGINDFMGVIENVCSTVAFDVTAEIVTVGGITGNNNGIIRNCYVNITSTIRGEGTGTGGSGPANVGGIAGQNNGTIEFCYTLSGDVYSEGDPMAASNPVGGIAGINQSGKDINNCVALNNQIWDATPSGDIGRIAGLDNSGIFSNNYAKDTMILLAGTPSAPHTMPPADIGSNKTNGESIGSSVYSSQDFWTRSSAPGADWGAVWGGKDEGKPWKWGSGRPILWFE